MDEVMKELVQEAVSGEVFGVWFLIGAALVFWMQAGFAMVEAGFTRAKNTGNIIMKNVSDFLDVKYSSRFTVQHRIVCRICWMKRMYGCRSLSPDGRDF